MMFIDSVPRGWANTVCTLLAVLLVSAQTPLLAGEGHAHGEAPAAARGPATPRFTAHSDLFEAVGLLGTQAFTVLIDRYETNAPVLDARVEVESGSLKSPLVFHADHGAYSMPAGPFQRPGTYPVTLTVVAGDQTDLLTGELVVPDPEAGHAHGAAARPWGTWAALALALLAAASTVVWRVRRPGRTNPAPRT